MVRKKGFYLALFGLILWFSWGGAAAQQTTGVSAVITSEYANIRITPVLGADVMASVPGGYFFEFVTGRSADSQWVQVDFNGDEGWAHISTLTLLSGNMDMLPVRDPRSIPYGGFEAPRAGTTSATSDRTATLLDWMHVRAGPGRGYVILAEAPIDTVVPLLGRTYSNSWVQVNFNGVLGWLSTRYLRFNAGAHILDLPIDGITADGLIDPGTGGEQYLDIIKLMLARVDLAQESLDSIRGLWTYAGLHGRASCQPYPAQPSDFTMPTALLASHYTQLYPVYALFNDSMANVRTAIHAFIDVCNQPGTVNPVGQATVIEALDVVALADAQFVELRRRLNELLPPPITFGIGECIFTFANETTVLPVIAIGDVIKDSFSRRKWISGYCFDAIQGETLIFETLQLKNSSVVHLLAVSPFDDPTNFVLTGRGDPERRDLLVGPVSMPKTGRYLLILYHIAEDAPPIGEFGLLIHQPFIGVYSGVLHEDPTTGEPILAVPPSTIPGGFTGTCPSLTFTCEQLIDCNTAYGCLLAGNRSLDPDNDGVPCEGTLCPDNSGGAGVCPGLNFTCQQLTTCSDAYACLYAGNFTLDPDSNGVPCEGTLCPASP